MAVDGVNLIAGEPRSAGPATIHSVDPRTGGTQEPVVHEADADEVDAACAAAACAVGWYASASPTERERLLAALADALGEGADEVVTTADRETALGRPRLESELERTTDQLRFLGAVARDGRQLDATIDPDGAIRRINVPLGPVAVFAASNFPLAFSVAGGDTASALAAGCPVVVKAHPSHPHTSELTARALVAGLEQIGAPPGSFSLVHGFEAGRRLVTDPRIRAVGFTGSRRGGKALLDLVADRDDPVPVHAEMGSVNPVVVTTAALRARRGRILDGYCDSLRLGTGQFCTSPGLLFVPEAEYGAVREGLVARLADDEPAPMLNADIQRSWAETTARWAATEGVEVVHDGTAGLPERTGRATVLAASASRWRDEPDLHEECFGPTSVVVRYRDDADLLRALRTLEGSLAAAVHAGSDDDERARAILDVLGPRAGRLIVDGWPTGVAVTHAMHHGGPWPATSDARQTSVGAAAVRRFLRPVCYQGVPEDLLPPGLQDANPWGLPDRRVAVGGAA